MAPEVRAGPRRARSRGHRGLPESAPHGGKPWTPRCSCAAACHISRPGLGDRGPGSSLAAPPLSTCVITPGRLSSRAGRRDVRRDRLTSSRVPAGSRRWCSRFQPRLSSSSNASPRSTDPVDEDRPLALQMVGEHDQRRRPWSAPPRRPSSRRPGSRRAHTPQDLGEEPQVATPCVCILRRARP